MAARSKTWDWGRLLVEIAGSKPAVGLGIFVVGFQVEVSTRRVLPSARVTDYELAHQ